jgi:hypothetical protein
MLSDPQSVTIGGTAVSLPRTAITANGASYVAPDSATRLEVLHTYGRRNRHMVRVRTDKIAADPLLASNNRRLSATAGFYIDVPPEGFSVTEQVALVKSLTDALSASTMALTTKVVGGES